MSFTLTFEQKLKKIAERLLEDDHKDEDKVILTKPIQEKYLKHIQQHRYTRRDDVRHKLLDLPVCVKCERLAFRDRRPGDPPPVLVKDEYGIEKLSDPYVTCPVCGYHGPAGPTVRMHVKEV